jgi:hypothetical protein
MTQVREGAKKPRVRWGKARTEFRRHEEDIRGLVLAGYPLRRIHEEFTRLLGGVSYQGFTRLVRSNIGPRMKVFWSAFEASEASRANKASTTASQSTPGGAPAPPSERDDLGRRKRLI